MEQSTALEMAGGVFRGQEQYKSTLGPGLPCLLKLPKVTGTRPGALLPCEEPDSS